MSAFVDTGFDIAAGVVAAAATPVPGAAVTPTKTSALRITVAISSNDTLQMIRDSGTAVSFGGGVTLGADRLSTFVATVVRGSTYTFQFVLGGTIRILSAEVVFGGVI